MVKFGKQLNYRSMIKFRQFFYLETKMLANLVLQGLNEVAIKEQVINYFVLGDEEEKVKQFYERYPFTIEIAFSDEFGF